jgi:uncharacterized protein YjbI with pentapeptide repeats
MGWLQDYGWVAGLSVAAALAVAGLVWWAVRRSSLATPGSGAAARRQADLTFAAAVVVTLTVGVAAVLWLLALADQVSAGKDRATLQADAVKTGATIALSTGGAAYLLLAYRRQRLDEVDTRERRITELYTKAVEQLGHEKAPVRLGALYSLKRLAQSNPEHRQTVVDVICAYLRMPYTPPARSVLGAFRQLVEARPAEDQDRAPHPEPGLNPDQELQVRQIAQHILADHLRLPPGISSAAAQRRRPSPREDFWPDINLDLTGATLVNLNFNRVSVVGALFNQATFRGAARFVEATFQGDASFRGAKFRGEARFVGATFQGDTWFRRAKFRDYASFREATFRGVWFRGAKFRGDVRFVDAKFRGDAGFSWAKFRGDVWFFRAKFRGDAGFDKAKFRGDASFRGATFRRGARFRGATFRRGAGFGGAQVLHLNNPGLNERRVWPDGYTVRPDPADPTRGTLVYREQAQEPEPGH